MIVTSFSLNYHCYSRYKEMYSVRPACCTCLLPGRGREVNPCYDSTTNATQRKTISI